MSLRPSMVIRDYGWRAGYQALALLCAIGGCVAFALIPKDAGRSSRAQTSPVAYQSRSVRGDLGALLRSKVFLLVIGGMFLCNLSQTLVGPQMKLMAMNSGATSEWATAMMSLYAVGVMLGRFVFGFSLDRFPTHLIAAIGLGLPGLGFLGLISSMDTIWVFGFSALLIGMAQGGEGDIAAYIVSRYFDIGKFSFIFSLIGSAMALATAAGAIILSLSLRGSDNFTPFIILSALTTLAGALLFLFIGRQPQQETVQKHPISSEV